MWARWTGPLAARMNSSRQNPKSNCLHLRFGGEGIVGSKEASLVAQMVKNLPAMQETETQSLGWEDLLEKGAAAAAAAAKSFQSCPTLCDPIDGSPRGPAVPGVL